MPGRLLRAVSVFAALVFGLSDGPFQAARPGDKSALVTVVAEAGAPIRDLKAGDFIVKEDGKKREVIDVKLADDPLSVALLIDTSQSPLGAARSPQDLRSAAAAFVKAIYAVNPDAAIALVKCGGAAVTTIDFTNKAGELDAAISRLYPDQQSSAVVLEALGDAGRMLAARPAPRRAIVSIDFNSSEGSNDRMVQQSADSVTNSGATLWAVSVRGTGPTSANREEVLNKMTKASGGKRFSSIDSSGLEGQLKNVAATLTSQYIVTFTHPGDGPAKSTTFETVGGPKVLLSPFMR
jgi:VWFA-related protein